VLIQKDQEKMKKKCEKTFFFENKKKLNLMPKQLFYPSTRRRGKDPQTYFVHEFFNTFFVSFEKLFIIYLKKKNKERVPE